MALALRLGRTLGELNRSLSASELKMWIEFDRRSPIGDVRGDIQSAQITAAVYNSQGIRTTLQDAVLRWGESDQIDDAGDAGALEGFLKKLAE
ncbi:DUF4035 domain-containing protein [Martelella alba]|uniref:DUF4035 domain-containing protein n=2 Tax=Martelella alba TaxID=2590451 RepID=A0ABY2SFH4_9HYPH|nr:DUF4035 domain-containing protein [Martelella alba]